MGTGESQLLKVPPASSEGTQPNTLHVGGGEFTVGRVGTGDTHPIQIPPTLPNRHIIDPEGGPVAQLLSTDSTEPVGYSSTLLVAGVDLAGTHDTPVSSAATAATADTNTTTSQPPLPHLKRRTSLDLCRMILALDRRELTTDSDDKADHLDSTFSSDPCSSNLHLGRTSSSAAEQFAYHGCRRCTTS